MIGKRILASVCALLMVTLTGCGDGGSGAKAVPEPSDDRPALFESGAPLGAGLVVPAGAVATTQPMPLPGRVSASAVSGWSVDLLLSDAAEAFNDLVQQSSDLGFELHLDYPSSLCIADSRSLDGGTSPWPVPEADGVPKALNCSVSGARVGDGVVEQVLIHVNQTFGDDRAAVGSITVEEMTPESAGQLTMGAVVAPTPVEPLPESYPQPPPPPVPPAIEVGDPLISQRFPSGAGPQRLVDESRPVIPPESDYGQGGFRAVLDIAGDPDEVMAGYVEQQREWAAEFGGPPEVEEFQLLGRRIVRSTASVDGVVLEVVMVVGLEGEPTRMVYETNGN